jgi:DNA modification methylase
MFPVVLPEAYMLAATGVGELVCDVFAGAGTSLIACENLKRCGYMLELNPVYCDVSIDRWERHTGHEAVLLEREEAAVAV